MKLKDAYNGKYYQAYKKRIENDKRCSDLKSAGHS
jgi:hypothetical protein